MIWGEELFAKKTGKLPCVKNWDGSNRIKAKKSGDNDRRMTPRVKTLFLSESVDAILRFMGHKSQMKWILWVSKQLLTLPDWQA